MAGKTAFWDGIAEKYAKQPIKNARAYEQTLERTRAYLKPGDAVLEIGCGTGSTALALAKDVKRVTASDISAKMIEIAECKAHAEGAENVAFLQATPFDERLVEERYEAVLAFSLLHLVEDRPSVIRCVHNLLKPGGVFVSKTVCLGEQSWIYRLLIPVMRAVGRAPYVDFVSSVDLERELKDAGFEIVESTTFDGAPHSRFLVARRP